MKLRTILFLTSLLLVITTTSVITLAQANDEKQKEERDTAPINKDFKVKLFEIKYRNSSSLRDAIAALGSGSRGARHG